MTTLSMALTFLATCLLLRRPVAVNRVTGAVLSSIGLLAVALVTNDGILRGFDVPLALAFLAWSAGAMRTIRRPLTGAR